MIYNIYIIYHIIEFWIVFEQLAHTKCTNAQLHNFDMSLYSASIQIWIKQLQTLRFLLEPEVNVLRNRVNLLNIVSQLFSDEESTQSVCLCILGVQKVQRFKGSKPKFEWSHKAVKSNYINIYIIIYILI